MTYGFAITCSATLCALSAIACRSDRASRFVLPYVLYGLLSDVLSVYVLTPWIDALRPANGPMRGLGVWLVGLNQWQFVTDTWVLLLVIALAFHRRRIAALAALGATSFFAIAMGVYHWMRADHLVRSFDSVLRVDATSEMLGACVALGVLVSIIHDGLRGDSPTRVGVGHFVMLMYAAAIPVTALLAYMGSTPNYDVRLAGLMITKTICIGAYGAAFAYERSVPNARLFVNT